MSTAAVRPTITTHKLLPNVVHRPTKKNDFTYTFQRIAPLLFVFLLGLSIYTKYTSRLVPSVVPPKDGIQIFRPTPWETTPPRPYVDTEFGTKRWSELKQSFSTKGTEDKSSKLTPNVEAMKEQINVVTETGKEKIEEAIKISKRKTFDVWAELAELSGVAKHKLVDDLGELTELGIEKVTASVEVGRQKWAKWAELGKEELAEVAEIGKEKIAAAVEVGKEKLAEVTEIGKEKWAEVSASPSMEKIAEVTEAGKEKLNEAIEKASELGLGVVDSTKEWVLENLPFAQAVADQVSDRIERVLETGSLSCTAQSPAIPNNVSATHTMPW